MIRVCLVNLSVFIDACACLFVHCCILLVPSLVCDEPCVLSYFICAALHKINRSIEHDSYKTILKRLPVARYHAEYYE
jgi:hypothetical protein